MRPRNVVARSAMGFCFLTMILVSFVVAVSLFPAKNVSATTLPSKSTLEVQVIGDPDRITWGDERTINTSESLRFQWSTDLANAYSAAWNVGDAPLPAQGPSPHIVAQKRLSPIPAAGQTSQFWINFKSFLPPNPPDSAATYYVQVSIFDRHHKTLGTSNAIKITYARAAKAIELTTDKRLITKLTLHIWSGYDDLRGGHDNLNVRINYRSGLVRVEENVNKGQKWTSGINHDVPIVFAEPIYLHDIKSITLTTTFTGGTFGDNWDMYLEVNALFVTDKTVKVVSMVQHRFTGDKHEFTVPIHWGENQEP